MIGANRPVLESIGKVFDDDRDEISYGREAIVSPVFILYPNTSGRAAAGGANEGRGRGGIDSGEVEVSSVIHPATGREGSLNSSEGERAEAPPSAWDGRVVLRLMDARRWDSP